jgi:hypothetical protein
MGAFAAMFIMVVMLIIGIPCLIAGIVLLVVRRFQKKKGAQLRRGGLVASIVLLVIAGIMITPPVGLVMFIRSTNNANGSDYVDTGKVALEYENDLDEESPFDVPYMIFEDEKYTDLALAVSNYGDVLVNLSKIETTEPVANVMTESNRYLLSRLFSAMLGGEGSSGTVSEVVGVDGPPMLFWDGGDTYTRPLYCPDVSLDGKLRLYSDDDAYNYFYAVYNNNDYYEYDYDSLDEILTHKKKTLALDREYYRELTEGLRLALEYTDGEQGSDEVLIGDSTLYYDEEAEYEELHIFSVSDDELLIREHAVLLMKNGKLYQTDIPYGLNDYDGPQFGSYDEEKEVDQLCGAAIPEDIGDAIIRAVGERDIERVDISNP